MYTHQINYIFLGSLKQNQNQNYSFRMKPNILSLESRNLPMGYGVFISQDCIMSHDVSILTTWQEGDQSERKKNQELIQGSPKIERDVTQLHTGNMYFCYI